MKNLWKNLKWRLFGETKMFYWWFAFIVLFVILFWGGIAFIAIHSIAKYW